MKNLIFILQRSFERYNLAQLRQEVSRMVVVLTEHYYQAFPESLKMFFDEFYIVPSSCHEGVFSKFEMDREAVKESVKKEINIAGGAHQVNLVSNDELNILIVGWLRDYFNIPGASEHQINLYRDKNVMKQCLAKHNIRVPKHILLDQGLGRDEIPKYYNELVRHFGEIFVVKPLMGAGSVGVKIISELSYFTDIYQKIIKENTTYGIEEFITGNVYHCDSIIQNDKILFVVASEYLHQEINYRDGKSHSSLILLPEDPLGKKIIKFHADVVNTLGYIDGLTHMEIFYTGDELVFIEIAARMAGVEMTPSHKNVFGIDFCYEDARIQAGIPVNITPVVKEYSFCGRIPYRKGRVLTLNEPEIESEYRIDWKIKSGDVIERDSATALDYSAFFIVRDNDYIRLRRSFNQFRDYIPYTVALESPSE